MQVNLNRSPLLLLRPLFWFDIVLTSASRIIAGIFHGAIQGVHMMNSDAVSTSAASFLGAARDMTGIDSHSLGTIIFAYCECQTLMTLPSNF